MCILREEVLGRAVVAQDKPHPGVGNPAVEEDNLAAVEEDSPVVGVGSLVVGVGTPVGEGTPVAVVGTPDVMWMQALLNLMTTDG